MNQSAGTKNIKVSIIIPLLEINDYLRESIPKILDLNYRDFEIIILPNKKTKEIWPKTRIIPTGFSNASMKRNLGVKKAKGEIIAFLDDDAYPKNDWLDIALRHFVNRKIVGVGGPAVTPDDDDIFQKASASVFESLLGGGASRNRQLSIGKIKYIEDWPTVNLLVRKKEFLATGGFDKRWWPGEDTKLCLDLLGYGKIIYNPKAIAYHHRRGSLIKHLRQVGNYGLHRGHFAKIYPETSFKLFYIFPSIFSVYTSLAIINLIFSLLTKYQHWQIINLVIFAPIIYYFLIMLIDVINISIRYKNPLVGVISIPYIFLTHFYYGIRFIIGYFSADIKKNTHSKKSQIKKGAG